MRRFAIAILGMMLCLPAQPLRAENGAREQPAAAKGDREKVKAKRPAGLEDREDVKRPAEKVDRETNKPAVTTAKPKPAEQPAAEPKRATVAPPAVKMERSEAKPSAKKIKRAQLPHRAVKSRGKAQARHAKPPRYHRARSLSNVAEGSDAQVLRARRVWLRALAHKYGFNHW